MDQNDQLPATADVDTLRQRVLARMAARLAHDFNNDLTVIGGQAELAQRPEIGRVPERLEQILNVAGSARSRTRLVLELAHAELDTGQVIAANAVREDVDLLVTLLAGRDATVSLHAQDDLVAVDKVRLRWLVSALMLAGVSDADAAHVHLFLQLGSCPEGLDVELVAVTESQLPEWLASAVALSEPTGEPNIEDTETGWRARCVLPASAG